MGSGPSTRKLTISNDDELGVIHISNGVAHRLAQGVVNPQTKVSTSQNVNQVQQTEHVSIEHTEKPRETFEPISRSQMADPRHVQPEYTISALKMQQQKEDELNDQNVYWQKRLQNLKDNHAKIDRILEDEYKRAVDQVTRAQGKNKVDANSVVPPCLENNDKVLRCYEEYPREILKCSSLVEEFSNCVDQRRASLIDARC